MVGLLGLAATNVAALPIRYDDFSSAAGLSLNGDAAQVTTGDGPVLRLVPATENKTGSAFLLSGIHVSAFSTYFAFRITNAGGMTDGTEPGGDGLVFAIQAAGATALGGGGGGIGYGGLVKSVGVEFDTWQQAKVVSDPASWDDPSSNHVGVNLNGAMDSVATATVSPRFDDGSLWYSWIDYDGATLQVRANQTGLRPGSALLSVALDIPSLLGTASGFVGFSSATAGAYGNHDLVGWEYRDRYDPIPAPAPLFLIMAGLIAVASAKVMGPGISLLLRR
jgi:hypothetical protein